MRLACLFVPDFLLTAALRVQPELRAAPLVVADGVGPRAPLLAVSAVALRRGITAGLTVAQAVAIDADLVVRPASPAAARAAQAALVDAAESFSPRVEDAGDGVVYLDLEGLGRLFESESQLAHALARRTVHLGIEAQVGVAGSKVAALLAARQDGGVRVIPRGEEWSFLAPVSVSLLEPTPELAQTMRYWGIRCIGELAELPVRAVGTRLGREGVRLMRRARGEDEAPLVPRTVPLHFEEGVDLDFAIETMEPLLFVLRGVLDRLSARLTVRGLVCGDLQLSLRLATRGRDERTVTVAAPSNDVKALLALVRLHLEAHPPPAAIEALRLAAVPERLRAAQLDLFRPHGPAPARLAVTLARLTAICGADRVGMPVVADSHRPDAYGVAPFEVSGDEGQGTGDGQQKANLPLSPSLVRRGELSNGDSSPLSKGGRQGGSALIPAMPIALRAVRPPRAVEVFCERDRPGFVRGEGFAGRVVQAAGPWRVHGEWWSDGGYARDYYDAQLSDGCVYRLFCDLRTQGWFVEGVYD
jgi:protein ImuB